MSSDFMQHTTDTATFRVCTVCHEPKPTSAYRTYRRACKACLVRYTKEWRARNPERRKLYHKRIYTHRYNLERNHKITIGQFDAMLSAQDGKCKICQKPISVGNKRLHIDHMMCGGKRVVRGLLCPECNKGLGLFYDKPDVLRSAAIYLERSNGQFVS